MFIYEVTIVCLTVIIVLLLITRDRVKKTSTKSIPKRALPVTWKEHSDGHLTGFDRTGLSVANITPRPDGSAILRFEEKRSMYSSVATAKKAAEEFTLIRRVL